MSALWAHLRPLLPAASVAYAEGGPSNPERSFQRLTRAQVKQHNTPKSVWVTYREKVYDITDFVAVHPGGKEKIMMAAGGAIDPYWNILRQHLADPGIFRDILSPMQVGVLTDYEEASAADAPSPYIGDPERSGELKVHSREPFLAETPVRSIPDSRLTPNEKWYVRNHYPVPIVDVDAYRLEVNGKPLSLEDLADHPEQRTVEMTVQCGGNRRSEFDPKSVSGNKWGSGAISSASFTGVPAQAIVRPAPGDRHLVMEGLDGLQASVPLADLHLVVFAHEMNGEELPGDHGFPVRAVVPGYVGVRNVKWLRRVWTSPEEAEGTWQRGVSYKLTTSPEQDASRLPALNHMPVSSAVTTLDGDNRTVRGWAYAGGGKAIKAVRIGYVDAKGEEVSAEAKLVSDGNPYLWTFFEHRLPAGLDDGTVVTCRAVDADGNTQPETVQECWNMRGLANNAVSRTTLKDLKSVRM